MSIDTLTIATRESPLALQQTHFVKAKLEKLLPNTEITLLPLKTKGDKFLDTSLSKIGGKGLFTKELERAMLDRQADLAVHSMKDMPSRLPEGLVLSAVMEREVVEDVLISPSKEPLHNLKQGAVIGTSSLRRQSQLLALRPDLQIKPLRGNINTRLKKCVDFDAIILAHAGLTRMALTQHTTEVFSTDTLLPAAGQGALGIECRSDDDELNVVLAKLNHTETATCVGAEREINRVLNGSCQVPIAAYAHIKANTFTLSALVGAINGRQIIKETAHGDVSDTTAITQTVAERLLQRGADKLIQAALGHD